MRRGNERRRRGGLSLVCIVLVASLWVGGAASGVGAEGAVAPQALDWIEPRALNVFDMAGQVPDSALAGHIVSYGGGGGIARYVSGQRNGDQVTIQLALYGLFYGNPGSRNTVVQMPGQPTIYDHMSSAAPDCLARFYAGGQEITDQVIYLDYTVDDLVKPQRNAGSTDRYPAQRREYVYVTPGPDGLFLPANVGGMIAIRGEYNEITALLSASVPDAPLVTLMGTQQATFQSYVGPGGVGKFQALLSQMRRRFDDRHPRIHLARPAGANYILFDYEPTPFNAYAYYDQNIYRPVGGTVRLAPDEAMLSADLVHGGAFPLDIAWQDADQSAGPMLSLLPPVDRITPPEFVIPAGSPWNSCYLRGDCSNSVLDQLYQRVSTISMVYLKVTPRSGAVQAIHLDMADDTWQAAALNDTPVGPLALANGPYRVWLPSAMMLIPAAPVLPTAPVPYGYFSNGRMVGYAH